jgi:hypothetical protein
MKLQSFRKIDADYPPKVNSLDLLSPYFNHTTTIPKTRFM